jgi:hypothetical protein
VNKEKMKKYVDKESKKMTQRLQIALKMSKKDEYDNRK